MSAVNNGSQALRRIREMMNRVLQFSASLILAFSPLVQADQTPDSIIETAATEVAQRLEGRRDYLEAHPDELYALVDDALLQHFDTRYSAYLVLGNHWKAAVPEQRDRFIDVFYRYLLRAYARGLLEFDPKTLVILPSSGVKGDRAIVSTEMRLDNGKVVPVDYRMRAVKKGWKVYDVRVDGISYVQNYRNQFNAEISALGLDALIMRLEAESEALLNPGPTGS